MIREPRVLLAEMGCGIDDAAEIHVWDSSADMRGGRRGVA
ncbi:MAG: Nitrile hydratase, alpha chain [Gammaproteobacteria bacterium]|nr:Nitrile hydratase, alpha chain [Gammaproteobacteria bacterium]